MPSGSFTIMALLSQEVTHGGLPNHGNTAHLKPFGFD